MQTPYRGSLSNKRYPFKKEKMYKILCKNSCYKLVRRTTEILQNVKAETVL